MLQGVQQRQGVRRLLHSRQLQLSQGEWLRLRRREPVRLSPSAKPGVEATNGTSSGAGSGVFGGDRAQFFQIEIVLEIVQHFVVDFVSAV